MRLRLAPSVLAFLQPIFAVVEPAATPVNVMGAAGVSLGASWALLRHRPTVFLCQALGSACFGIHYVLLGSATGAVMCAISMLQSLMARGGPSGGWRTRVQMASLGVILIATYVTWLGLPSLAAALGSSFATIGRLQRDLQRMRLFFLACSLLWAVHNLLVGSRFGNASDIMTISGIAIGLYVHRWRATAPSPAIAPPIATARLQ